MTSKFHNQLVNDLRNLGRPRKSSDTDYAEWVSTTSQLDFLKKNAGDDEIVMYASGCHTFILGLAVPRALVESEGTKALMEMESRPDRARAAYVTGGGSDDFWVESGRRDKWTEVDDFIFIRKFQEWKDETGTYIEVKQEYLHLAEVHWRSERSAYCRLDDNGDIEEVVSITVEDGREPLRVVTFKTKPLEVYLAATDKILLRKFDFTCFESGKFWGWPDGEEETFETASDIHCVGRIVPNHAGYKRGVSIVRMPRTRPQIFRDIRQEWGLEAAPRQYATFIAIDWRNRRVRRISTDPDATTSYWQAEGNDYPFELSPAFFHVDVLQRYKSDSDKYTVDDRRITCRNAWTLRGMDINEEGQIHAYICDLRELPNKEQLYWKSFNERPKGTISRRAMANDFEGRWWSTDDPLREIKQRLRGWERDNVWWWRSKGNSLYEAVSYPSGDNRDEWGEAFLNLCKLVIEGFPKKNLTGYLVKQGIAYERREGTLKLLEKAVQSNLECKDGGYATLSGLAYAQDVRTKVKSHSSGASSIKLAREAIRQHGSLSSGFRAICGTIAEELERIERTFSLGTSPATH